MAVRVKRTPVGLSVRTAAQASPRPAVAPVQARSVARISPRKEPSSSFLCGLGSGRVSPDSVPPGRRLSPNLSPPGKPPEGSCGRTGPADTRALSGGSVPAGSLPVEPVPSGSLHTGVGISVGIRILPSGSLHAESVPSESLRTGPVSSGSRCHFELRRFRERRGRVPGNAMGAGCSAHPVVALVRLLPCRRISPRI